MSLDPSEWGLLSDPSAPATSGYRCSPVGPAGAGAKIALDGFDNRHLLMPHTGAGPVIEDCRSMGEIGRAHV